MEAEKSELPLLLFLALCPFPGYVTSLNLDERNVTVYSGPKGSYFGFSVDFYQSSNKLISLVVGAPKANTSQSGVVEGGAVFLCPWFPNGSSCDTITFDSEGNENYTFPSFNIQTSKSHQWFGASVRSEKEHILACAPLYHWNVLEDHNESGSTPVGNCKLRNMSTGAQADYSPCKNTLMDVVYANQKFTGDRRYCEAGFSAEITKDGKVLLGAPGGYYFQGQVIAASISDIFASMTSTNPVRFVSKTTFSPEVGFYDVYKGYSVAVGEFTGDSVPDYAIGAPNDESTAGSVKIYNGNGWHSLQLAHSFPGMQVASFFGHTVAVTDINSDGRDDVLVGAPLFMERLSSKQLREVGQVSLYLQRERSTFPARPDVVLTGTELYGRFGSAIAPLGDIDHDGFNDIAVGAPFSDGEGQVYIFMGQADGLSPHYAQVLQSPFRNLGAPAAFGFTLRGGTDIDSNGYPDLVVGAWGASQVAVFRAQAVLRAKAKIFLYPDFLNPEVKACKLLDSDKTVSCFTVLMCISISGHRIPDQIELDTELQLDKMKQKIARRTLLLSSSQPQEHFTMNIHRVTGTSCTNRTAYLRHEAEVKDKLSPIFISLSFSLRDSAGVVMQGQAATLAQVTSQSTIKTTPQQALGRLSPRAQEAVFTKQMTRIILDCGPDNVCVPDLSLAAKAESKRLLIGDESPVLLLVAAENRGEGAYEAELRVQVPTDTHYQGTLSNREGYSRLVCTPKMDNGTVFVVCDLGNPMKQGQKLQAGLYFSVGNLEEVESHVLFQLQIKSKNSRDPDSNVVDLRINVSAVARLEMRGGSSPVECVLPLTNWKPLKQPKTLEDVGPLVEHVYELHNQGPATVNARVVVEFPSRMNREFLLYVFANASEESLTCHTDSPDIDPYKLVEKQNMTVTAVHRVNKREADQLEPQKDATHVNCSSGNGIVCLKFVCEARGLERGASAVVRVRSRLWVHTFLERPYEGFVLQSKAFYTVQDMPSKIQPELLLSGHAETNTTVVWKSPDGRKKVPVWWIVVAVIAGLFLLSLLSFVFWKVGFFKRERPPSECDESNELNPSQPEYATMQTNAES